jgi:hypothetical protein
MDVGVFVLFYNENSGAKVMFFAGSGKNEAALLIIYRSQHNNPLVFNLNLLQYKEEQGET